MGKYGGILGKYEVFGENMVLFRSKYSDIRASTVVYWENIVVFRANKVVLSNMVVLWARSEERRV